MALSGAGWAFLPSLAQDALADGEQLVPDQAVVLFVSSIPTDVDTIVAPYGQIVGRSDNLAGIAVKTNPGSLGAFLSAMDQRTDVDSAYQSKFYWMTFVPNDPGWNGNEEIPQQWGLHAIGAEQAWDVTLGSHLLGANTREVAVIDTGVSDHPDLVPNTQSGDPLCGPDKSFVGLAPPPIPVDEGRGHGTQVAGIIAGVINNGIGIAGLSQSCIMDLKIFGDEGLVGDPPEICEENLFCIRFPEFRAALAIDWATANGAEIINMSFGGPADDFIERVIVRARLAGVIMIAAAGNLPQAVPGNDGCVGELVVYPAKYPEVIAVSALVDPLTRDGFSKCGAEVDIAAPTNVPSTHWQGGYDDSFGGTSGAAPHVSGVAALVLTAAHEANPPVAMDDGRLRCLLRKTADDIGAPGRDPLFGFGRLDAREAVELARFDAALNELGCL